MYWARVALALLTGLVLTALTLWTGTYFFLGTGAGQGLLMPLVPKGVAVERVLWGPLPNSIRAAQIRIERRPLRIDARALEATVALPSFDITDVVLDIASVTVDTTMPAPPVVAGTAAAPKRPTPVIPRVRAAIGELWFVSDGAQAHVRDARVETAGGRIDGAIGGAVGGLPVALATGPCHVSFSRSRRVLGWDHCAATVTIREGGKDLDIRHLGLTRGDGLVLSASGHVSLAGDKPKAELLADVALSRLEAESVAGKLFPWGFEAQGAVLALDKGIVDGRIAAVHASGLAAGAVRLSDVSFTLPHIAVAPGLLIPAIDVDAHGLYAARAEGLGWALEHLTFGRFQGAIEKKLEGFVEAGNIATWQVGETALGPVGLDVTIVMGLTGGTIAGDLATPSGALGVKSRLKSSPITKRTTFTVELAFAALEAPLMDFLLHDLAADARAKLGHPVAGSAELALDVEREVDDDGAVTWVSEVAWDATALRGPGPDGHTPAAFEWDGSGWNVADPEAAPDAPDDAPDEPTTPDRPDPAHPGKTP